MSNNKNKNNQSVKNAIKKAIFDPTTDRPDPYNHDHDDELVL